MTFDAPLYKLAKKIQIKYKEDVGEDKIVLIPGGMHIEKIVWEILVQLLEESGWTTLLTNADIASSGRSRTFISVFHIYRTHYIHQVTSLALYTLQCRAYEKYHMEVNNDETIMSMEEWL